MKEMAAERDLREERRGKGEKGGEVQPREAETEISPRDDSPAGRSSITAVFPLDRCPHPIHQLSRSIGIVGKTTYISHFIRNANRKADAEERLAIRLETSLAL